MVTKQIFRTIRKRRIALHIGVVLSGLLLSAQAAAQAPIDGVVIDLRSSTLATRMPSQQAFRDALSQFEDELQLSLDQELESRLGRSPYSPATKRGHAALDSAALAFGALDCSSTRTRTASAILDLAAAMAAGVVTTAELRQAHLYRFLCADREGDFDAANLEAKRLRALRPGVAPVELSTATWGKYPELDAQSNLFLHPVEFTTSPSAQVWLDYKQVGTTPTTLFLSEGEHLIALGDKSGSISQQITVSGRGKVELKIPEAKTQWSSIPPRLAELRAADSDARQAEMRDLMAAVEVQVAFVMREPGRVAVWFMARGEPSPTLVGHAPSAAIAGQIALQHFEETQSQVGLDPSVALLREEPLERETELGRRWWIYGIVLGAATIGAGLIIAQDMAEDRQRIEVTLP